MTSPTLYTMAEDLMRIVVQAISDNGLMVPDRQVIYVGSIPADCEQVAVVFDGWSPEPAPEGVVTCMAYRWAANMTVLLTRRCAPVMTGKAPPSAADMSALAMRASDDAEALLDVVARVGEHGAGVSVLVTEPKGGLQSTVLEISLPVTRGIAWHG